MQYLIGQRVIVDGDTIAHVIKPKRAGDNRRVWVKMPDGEEQWRAFENVQPLPGGQL